MIVLCTSCQAKFRVADEKIGPRGSKVRCSRCQTVFAVHPELGAMPLAVASSRPSGQAPIAARAPASLADSGRASPAFDVDLEAPAPSAAPPAADPFAFASPPEPASARQDPFAPATFDPFGSDRPAPEPDPFARSAAPAAHPFGWTIPSPAGPGPIAAADGSDPFQADPFAPSPASDPFSASGGAPDPFSAPGAAQRSFDERGAELPDAHGHDASQGADDPWAATGSRAPLAQAAAAAEPFAVPARGMALTDLADLLGSAPAPAAAAGEASAARAGPDLTLEDRDTPPAFRAAGAGRDLSLGGFGAPEPGFDGPAFALQSEPAFAFGAPGLDLGPDLTSRPEPAPAARREPSAALALATEATPAPRPRVRPPPLPPPRPRAPSALDLVPVADAPAVRAAVHAAPLPDVPVPRRRSALSGSRLLALTVNAVALAALLAATLAMLVVWRGGRLEAASFRPAAIAAALRHGTADGPFAATAVRSGLYERERGAPILFVRGAVVSRAPAPVRSVSVSVEVVREGTVVARGEALAGAVPGPEELWRASSPEALARVARRAAARAPEEIRPGDEVPFLVAIDDYPADLAGAALRVSATPEAARRR